MPIWATTFKRRENCKIMFQVSCRRVVRPCVTALTYSRYIWKIASRDRCICVTPDCHVRSYGRLHAWCNSSVFPTPPSMSVATLNSQQKSCVNTACLLSTSIQLN